MEAFTPYLIDVLAPLTLAMLGVSLLLLGILLKDLLFHEPCSRLLMWVAHYGLLIMFLVSLGAAAGSLFFSEIAFFVPCKLCWFQRIFLYPQVFILGLALWRRDRRAVEYVLMLSVIGMTISIIHYIEQIQSVLNPAIFDPLQPCDLTGISCRATEFLQYGFVTIPLMALAPFLLNTVISLMMLRCEKKR